MSEVAEAAQVLAKPMPSRGRGDVGAKRPSVSALGGKSNVKPNGRRRCDGADYKICKKYFVYLCSDFY